MTLLTLSAIENVTASDLQDN